MTHWTRSGNCVRKKWDSFKNMSLNNGIYLLLHYTVFENHRKSLIQHYERSKLSSYLSGQKLIKNAKMIYFGEFLKTWSLRSSNVTGQVTLIWTKIGENALIEKFKCDILDDFQTLCYIKENLTRRLNGQKLPFVTVCNLLI